MSLRTRLVLLTLSILALAFVAVSIFTHTSTAGGLDAQMDQRLGRAIERSQGLDTFGGRGPGTSFPGGPPGNGDFILTARKTGDTVTGTYTDFSGESYELSAADAATLAKEVSTADPRDVSLEAGRYRVRAISAGSDELSIVGVNTDDAYHTLLRLDLTLLGVSLAVLAGAGVISTLMVRRTLAPLHEVATTAEHVASTPLSQGEIEPIARVRDSVARRTDEVGSLATAFNTMLENVDSSLRARHDSEVSMRRFIADASHELRTPLTSVAGYADLLRTLDAGDEVRQAAERISMNGERMKALVESLLLLARLDNTDRTSALNIGPVDVGELLAETVMDAAVSAPGHVFDLDVEGEDLEILADSALVTTLITNVVSNAHKHTADGTTVRVSATATPGSVKVTVADNGAGMPAELMERVFERFSQGDGARSANAGSSGLGMSIAKAVVDAQGGHLTVDSAPGEGTTVRIELPRNPREASLA